VEPSEPLGKLVFVILITWLAIAFLVGIVIYICISIYMFPSTARRRAVHRTDDIDEITLVESTLHETGIPCERERRSKYWGILLHSPQPGPLEWWAVTVAQSDYEKAQETISVLALKTQTLPDLWDYGYTEEIGKRIVYAGFFVFFGIFLVFFLLLSKVGK